jgi:hypothetical protein
MTAKVPHLVKLEAAQGMRGVDTLAVASIAQFHSYEAIQHVAAFLAVDADGNELRFGRSGKQDRVSVQRSAAHQLVSQRSAIT